MRGFIKFLEQVKKVIKKKKIKIIKVALKFLVFQRMASNGSASTET